MTHGVDGNALTPTGPKQVSSMPELDAGLGEDCPGVTLGVVAAVGPSEGPGDGLGTDIAQAAEMAQSSATVRTLTSIRRWTLLRSCTDHGQQVC